MQVNLSKITLFINLMYYHKILVTLLTEQAVIDQVVITIEWTNMKHDIHGSSIPCTFLVIRLLGYSTDSSMLQHYVKIMWF